MNESPFRINRFAIRVFAMDNESKWYDRWRPGIVLSTIPIVFFGVLVGLGLWQDCSDSYEVSAFIENHRKSIQSQRSNPSVHQFELSHDPAYQGRLLIQIDVDDKQTYLRLADTIGDCYRLNELPQWKTHIRNGEDLEMDSGQVAMAAEYLKTTSEIPIVAAPAPIATCPESISRSSPFRIWVFHCGNSFKR